MKVNTDEFWAAMTCVCIDSNEENAYMMRYKHLSCLEVQGGSKCMACKRFAVARLPSVSTDRSLLHGTLSAHRRRDPPVRKTKTSKVDHVKKCHEIQAQGPKLTRLEVRADSSVALRIKEGADSQLNDAK